MNSKFCLSPIVLTSVVLFIILELGFYIYNENQRFKIPAYFIEKATEMDKHEEEIIGMDEEREAYCRVLRTLMDEFDLANETFDTLRIDNQLAEIYSYTSYTYDSSALCAIMRAFRTQLNRFMKRKESFDFSFPNLSERISMLESSDHRFRLISFDDALGGTMRFYQTYLQYPDETGTINFVPFDLPYEEGAPVGANSYYWYLGELYEDAPYYVLISRGQGSTQLSWYIVNVVSFENGEFTYHDDFFPKEIKERFGSEDGMRLFFTIDHGLSMDNMDNEEDNEEVDAEEYEVSDEESGVVDEEYEEENEEFDFIYDEETGIFTVNLIGEDPITFNLVLPE
ncbi:MAG: hypothetical protein RR303_03195 [Bacteroidales bacterium]